eukprot:sb/3475713/
MLHNYDFSDSNGVTGPWENDRRYLLSSCTDFFTNVSQWVPSSPPEFFQARDEVQHVHFRERSRDKIKGTKVISGLALVGVGAGIKSLSHLNRSRDKTEGTKMISVLELVGVGAKIKSLSHLVN